MLPLSSITQTLPVQNFAGPDALRAPGVDAPLPLDPPSEISSTKSTTDSFGSLLGKMVEEVNAKQNVANDAVGALQSGGNVSLHQAVIAMEEASVSFQLMVEVRNKLLDSYQELMRMQI
jgi:flagellar hook-basal body complex protein FliE